MKKIMPIAMICLLSVLTFFPFFTWAQGVYFKGGLGVTSQSSNEFFGGELSYEKEIFGVVSLALGADLGRYFMAEVELSSRGSDLKYVNGTPGFGDLRASFFGANGIFKVPFNYDISGLLGLGLGVIDAELTDELTGNIAGGSAVAAQVILGVQGAIGPRLEASAELRFLSSDDLRLDGTSGAWGQPFDYGNTSLLLGLKYNF